MRYYELIMLFYSVMTFIEMIVSFFFSKALHSRTSSSTPGEYSFDCRNKIDSSCILHSRSTAGEALEILFGKVEKHFGGLDYGVFYALYYNSYKRLTLSHCGTFNSVSFR